MAAVFLVDDDDVSRQIVRRMIEHAGHHVDEASDGEAALAALEQGLQPDCVVLDLMMPRLDGVSVLRRMTGDPRWRSIPVLLMTSLDEGREVEEARSLGFRRHFVKAYWHVGDLLQTINHATHSSSATPPGARPTAN